MLRTATLHRSLGSIGARLYGAASLLLGVASLALHDQLTSDWHWAGAPVFLVVASAAQIAGGAALQLERSARTGALILATTYLVFACTFVPGVIAQPALYATWGEVFYRLASVAAAILYLAARSPGFRRRAVARRAVVLLGLCYGSFAIEQLEYIGRTATLVPTWVPPSGMFWAVVTTIALGLAAVSLVSGARALLAARLAAAMFAIFGITIWIPALIADPHLHSNWSEGLETFLIAGGSAIAAEYLATRAPRTT